MFGIQPIHIIIVLAVALLIFGPKRLPEMGRGIGRAINEFRSGTKEMTDGFLEETKKPSETPQTPLAPGVNNPRDKPGITPVPPQISSTASAGHFCIQCGTANSPEAHFCSNCGTLLPVKAA